MSTFAPLDRRTAPEACAAQLRQQILAGRLSPGERLPPERSLAEQLGVTRVTLRSALAGLAAEGLIEARQGSGTRVLDFRLAGGPGLLPALVEQEEASGRLARTVGELLALRRGLARSVLEALAESPPEEPACEAVDAAVEAFGAVAIVAVDGEGRATEAEALRELAEADLAVLRAVVGATGSVVFPLALNPVAQALGSLPLLRAAVYRAPLENLAGWQALAAWLRAPSGDALDALLELLAERDRATVDLVSARQEGSP